jgi:hypothetical protein
MRDLFLEAFDLPENQAAKRLAEVLLVAGLDSFDIYSFIEPVLDPDAIAHKANSIEGLEKVKIQALERIKQAKTFLPDVTVLEYVYGCPKQVKKPSIDAMERLYKAANNRMGITAEEEVLIAVLSRAIAALDKSLIIQTQHFAEAMQYVFAIRVLPEN